MAFQKNGLKGKILEGAHPNQLLQFTVIHEVTRPKVNDSKGNKDSYFSSKMNLFRNSREIAVPDTQSMANHR